MENLAMEMFGSNMMGIKQHDYEITHEFLKHSRTEGGLQDVSDAFIMKQETLDGNLVLFYMRFVSFAG